jgi:hypothetical protein
MEFRSFQAIEFYFETQIAYYQINLLFNVYKCKLKTFYVAYILNIIETMFKNEIILVCIPFTTFLSSHCGPQN